MASSGDIYIADSTNGRIRGAAPDGNILTLAGTGNPGFSGDGGPATNAQFSGPVSRAIDAQGNLFIADLNNHRIRRVSPGGIISTVSGTGQSGFPGDGGQATAARLNAPLDVVTDEDGNLYIADSSNNRVRKVVQPASAHNADQRQLEMPVDDN